MPLHSISSKSRSPKISLRSSSKCRHASDDPCTGMAQMSLSASNSKIPTTLRLGTHRDAYYGGGWHAPFRGRYADTISPGTGETLASVADCSAEDALAAIAAAKAG